MQSNTFLLCLTLASALPVWGRPQIDKIVMKNGDQFTCEIKKLDRGVLYVSFDYVDGTVSVQWLKVARVESTQLFVVHAAGGAVYTGILRTPETAADQPVQIDVVDVENNHETRLQRSHTVELQQTAESIWRRISGNLGSGLIFSKGNNTVQYNLNSQLRYRTSRWAVQGDFTSSLSASSGAATSTRNQLNLGGYRLLRRSNWYLAGLGSILQSAQQGINRQDTLGGGLGRFLTNSNRTRISVTAGVAWQGTTYAGGNAPQGREDLAAGALSTNVQLFKFKKTALDFAGMVFPAISQGGRVRALLNSSYKIQIINNLWWNFTVYGNWDNRPPPSLAGSDYGSSSGLTYTFN